MTGDQMWAFDWMRWESDVRSCSTRRNWVGVTWVKRSARKQTGWIRPRVWAWWISSMKNSCGGFEGLSMSIGEGRSTSMSSVSIIRG